jgi:hypothetical protein
LKRFHWKEVLKKIADESDDQKLEKTVGKLDKTVGKLKKTVGKEEPYSVQDLVASRNLFEPR